MIEKVTAVIADVDGTLNVKGTTPMPRTLDALERLHERGVLFGTASGRPLDHRALDKAHDWGLSFEFDLAIGMNGGDLWDRFHEGIEHIMLLKKEYIAEICEFMWPLDCNVIVYENAYDHVLVKRFDEMQLASMERNSSHPEKATIAQMALKPLPLLGLRAHLRRLRGVRRARPQQGRRRAPLLRAQQHPPQRDHGLR